MRIPLRKKIFLSAAAILLIAVLLCGAAAETEEYAAQTMRLLQYTGDVQILDAEGSPRFVMENVRFSSGETMMTGESSLASVGLDESKIVTVDELSSVEFIQQEGHILLSLKEGTLLLDVEKKLDENEAVDIQTSTMTVGIRGTIVGISVQPARPKTPNPGTETGQQSDGQGQIVTLWMMAGVGHVEFVDGEGNRNTFRASAGTAVILTDQDGNGTADSQPLMQQISSTAIPAAFVDYLKNNPSALLRVTNETGLTLDDLENGGGEGVPGAGPAESDYAASGSWLWLSKVTLVAQSATKMYDGKPLSRPDVLVDGLPVEFSCSVRVSGEQTDAGSSGNVIKDYAIYNANNEDVTDHFIDIETVNGTLTVEKAQLTVWTDSAEKTYDGAPLTAKEAKLHRVPGYEKNDAPWKNSSFLVSPNVNEQTLYGICGTVIVHGKSPLTGATQDIPVNAGEKLTIYLNSAGETIRFEKTAVAADALPPELVNLYLDNPDLLAKACEQTGWTKADIEKRKAALGSANTADLTSRDGLNVSAASADSLILDFTDVQIHVDSSVTNYDGRALGPQEAKFISIPLDPTITVTATGSQTDVGSSKNGYEIKWGDANPNNYTVVEDLGTLTVYPAILTVTTGSAAKAYDGTPLTCEDASVAGLAGGETATVTATGTQTDVGTSDNTYTLSWGTAKAGNYTVTDSLGILTVTDALTPGAVSFTAGSASKIYDGTPLTASNATAVGLPEGYTFSAVVEGSQTDAGAGTSTVVSWTILDASGADVTASFSNVSTATGTLKVNPAPLTITTGSASKAYDGTALTAPAKITGLVGGETATATATGSQTDVGTSDNTYTLSWGTAKAGNYTVTETLGTLKVTANTTPITFTAASTSKTYDGSPLTDSGVTAEGLPAGFTFTAAATGSQTDAGSSNNTVASYAILKDGSDVTANFSSVSTATGTLKVNPAPLTVTTGSATKSYDGSALTATAEITGLVGSETATATAIGSQTDVGTSDNTYTLSWGTAKEANYTVTETLGTLEVTPNTTPITFTAASTSKTYDGTPLTDSGVTAEGLPAGFTFTAAATGTQTDAGSSDNTVSSYAILKDGSNVTANFSSVSTAKGTLTVSPAPLTVTTRSASKAYDGTALTATAEITGLVGSETATATAIGSQTDVGTSDNTYTLSWGTAKAGNYSITETLGTLEVTANTTPITFTAASTSKTYDGAPLTDSGVTAEGLPAGFTFTAAASGSQTDAGSSDNTVSSYAILKDGSDVTANFSSVSTEKGTLKVNPAPLTVTTGSASKPYDGTALTASAEITGLIGSETATATAIGSQTDVGTSDNTYTLSWGTAKEGNYTVTDGEIGTLEVTANNTYIVITSGTSSGTYTPFGLKNSDYSVEGDLPAALTLDVEITGFQEVAGTSNNTIAGYTIKDQNGDDKKAYFTNVHLNEGTLTLSKAKINVWTSSDTQTYKGSSYQTSNVSWTGVYGGDNPRTTDLSITDHINSWVRDVGTYELSYKAELIREDLMDKYEIGETKFGTFTITPAALTVTAGTASKVFDGTPLKDTTASLEGLLGSDAGKATVTATATITNADSVPYTYEIDWGEVNSGNYTVSEAPDTLTVDPLGLKFDLGGKTMTYGSVDFELYPTLTYTNGNHTGETVDPDLITFDEVETYTVKYTLFTGDTATLTVQGTVEDDAGEYSFTCNASVSGNASNYNFSYDNTTVTIKPLKVTIKTESQSKTYDGKPYPQDTEVPAPTITIEDAPGDFTIMFSVQNKEGQITNAGSVKNGFEIDWGDENPDNYIIIEDPNPGTLTITKATLTVSTPSGSHAYDGNPYTLGPATVTGLVGTETVTVNATGSQTEPGSSPNTYEVIWEDGTADKNNYEVVDGEIGTLTVFLGT